MINQFAGEFISKAQYSKDANASWVKQTLMIPGRLHNQLRADVLRRHQKLN